MDSISTSARVSSNTFIKTRPVNGERYGKEKTRGKAGVLSIPIALHPFHQGTDDSGLVLTEPPNRRGLNSPLRFRRKLPGPFHPRSEVHRNRSQATDGRRASTREFRITYIARLCAVGEIMSMLR